MKPRHFILNDDNQCVPAPLMEWAAWFARNDARRVLQHTRKGRLLVSTVFLGLDHRFFGNGPPLTFETMIFNGPYHGYMDRYSSYDDALMGHRRACRLAFTVTPSRNAREGRYLERLHKHKQDTHHANA